MRCEGGAAAITVSGNGPALSDDLRRFGQAARATGPARATSLCSLIESEIIPRLMMAHVAPSPGPVPADGPAEVTGVEVEALSQRALSLEADALLGHVDSILARGVPFDAMLVRLIAPAARLLGEYWKEDRCDFIDVTMALWRLQEVVRSIADRLPPIGTGSGTGYRALFATMPGDQHSFGTVVIDELFRRHGWITDRMSEAETPDLLRRVGEGWYDLVGLTVTCDCHIAPLGPIVAGLRNVSRNPRVCVMVGGRVLGVDPDLAVRAGADGTAREADLALDVATRLVRQRVAERFVI